MGDAAGQLAHRLHLLRLPQLGPEALLLRHVLDHGDGQRVRLGAQQPCRDLHGHDVVGLGPEPVLAGSGRGLLKQLRQAVRQLGAIVRMRHVGERAFVQLEDRVTEQATERGVHAGEAQVGRENGHADRRAVEYGTQLRLVLAQGLLRDLALPALGHLRQRAARRRRQTLEVVLQNEIGGAGLERRRGLFLADGAGHHQEGDVRRQLDGHGQRLQAVGAGKRVVRNDEIEATGSQRGPECLEGRDAHDLGRDAFRGQATRDELAVRRAVLQVQDVQAAHAACLQLPTMAGTCSNSFDLSRNASAPSARQL